MTRQLSLPVTDEERIDLVGARRRHLARFISWATAREAVDSLRLSNRSDVRRVRGILDAFAEPWWAAVVYTCFDSEIGTLAVAEAFPRPVDPAEAARLLLCIDLPVGAVQHHRTQPGHTGAKIALVSACARAHDFERILQEGQGFHDRYEALQRLRAKQWGRTTCFDLLVRTGQLGIGAEGDTSPTARTSRTRPALGTGSVWSGGSR